MKRILLIVTMLMLVTPALAGVTVTATAEGPNTVVRVSYSSDVNVRAFALDINVDANATITRIYDYNTGDTNGYGIFPGTFRDYFNASSPNWVDPCYKPVAPSGDPGAKAGLGTGAITVELGSLVANLATIRSGTLFRLDVNSGGNPDCNLRVALNSVRAGIVGGDGNAVASALNGCKVNTPVPAPPCATVPNIVGMCSMTDANNAITGTTPPLVVGTITYQYDNSVAPGCIISQNPSNPDCVAGGTPVNYVVSLGKPAVPNVVGQLCANAAGIITGVDNLVVGNVTTAYDNAVPAGTVISQNPIGGTLVNIGSAVDYVCSLGQPQVPNVVGQLCANAAGIITGVDNLVVGVVTTAYSLTVPAGTVISQNPIGGTPVNIGSAVDYVCSLGIQPPAWIVYGPKDWDLNITPVWAPVAGATGYKLERSSSGAGGPWTQVYDGNNSGNVRYKRDAVTAGSYRYKVRAYNAVGTGTDYATKNVDCVSSWETCFPTADANYASWKTAGRPRPWCYKRQCHGDASGTSEGSTKSGLWWVGTPDLTILQKVWLVQEPPFGVGVDSNDDPNAVGADMTRSFEGSTKSGIWRVGTPDLTVLQSYWLVKESPFGPGVPTTNCGGSL